jgi:hypothetical protein
MLLLTLTLFGLIGSEHYLAPPLMWFRKRCALSDNTPLHNDTQYYNLKRGYLSREKREKTNSFFINRIFFRIFAALFCFSGGIFAVPTEYAYI